MTKQIRIKCKECGTIGSFDPAEQDNIVAIIPPCPTCCSKAREDGFDDGDDVGFKKGYETGHRIGYKTGYDDCDEAYHDLPNI